MKDINFKQLREEMVKYQIRRRGIRDDKVLKVMLEIPREEFVPEKIKYRAYEDNPLPIEAGQTISQPYIVALMTELLKLTGKEKVLEIGTGSGYQTAILARLSREVYTIDRIPVLTQKAKDRLTKLGFNNIRFKTGDGTLGWKEYAPYDRIIVTAAAPDVPSPLVEQLKINGRMVIPVGSRYSQIMKIIIKKPDKIVEKNSIPCIFVKLIGEKGWKD